MRRMTNSTKNIPPYQRLSLSMRIVNQQVCNLFILFFLTFFSIFGTAKIAIASDVLLMSGGVRGQGTLQRRGNECIVITPKHVVENSDFGVFATFPDRTETEAIVLERYAEDIALLRLETQPSDGCPDRAFNENQLKAILNSAADGVLKRRDETGAASLLQVDISGYNEHRLIYIEPRSSSKSIKQGFSGSVLYINSQAVGMLINNEKSGNETGLVLRAETINASIDPFFQSVQGERTLHLSLDSTSDFLLSDLHVVASRNKFAVGQDAASTSYDMHVSSELKTLNTDTDKLAEYSTRIVVSDTLDRIVIDQTFAVSGNSFVSLETAQANAQKQLAERIRQSNLLGELL